MITYIHCFVSIYIYTSHIYIYCINILCLKMFVDEIVSVRGASYHCPCVLVTCAWWGDHEGDIRLSQVTNQFCWWLLNYVKNSHLLYQFKSYLCPPNSKYIPVYIPQVTFQRPIPGMLPPSCYCLFINPICSNNLNNSNHSLIKSTLFPQDLPEGQNKASYGSIEAAKAACEALGSVQCPGAPGAVFQASNGGLYEGKMTWKCHKPRKIGGWKQEMEIWMEGSEV